jgi:hypothetical protein
MFCFYYGKNDNYSNSIIHRGKTRFESLNKRFQSSHKALCRKVKGIWDRKINELYMKLQHESTIQIIGNSVFAIKH